MWQHKSTLYLLQRDKFSHVLQARLLPDDKCELIVHDVDSHRLAITLNRHKKLLPIIRAAILKELDLYEPPKLVNLV